MPLRDPLAQPTTTGTDLGISLSRLPKSCNGMLMVPGALAWANSPGDLTSIKIAPFLRSSGSMATTFLEAHHL